MPTTSTFAAFKAALTAAVDGVADCQVSYRWPGPETEGEGIYLADVDGATDIDSIKEGRKFRIENYSVEFFCQSYTAAPTLADLAAADVRVAELYGFLEDVLADDPTVGGVVRWAYPSRWRTETKEFDRGLAMRLTGSVAVMAHMT